MRAILYGWLSDLGFDIVEAADGREAMEQFAALGPVDVAIVDWNMPVMTGYELLVELRASPTFDAMPILMISTEGSEANMRQALDAGANAYIAKPVTETLLREKLRLLGFEIR